MVRAYSNLAAHYFNKVRALGVARSAQTIQYKIFSLIKKGNAVPLPFFDQHNFKAPEKLPFDLSISDTFLECAAEFLQKSSATLPPGTDIRLLWEHARCQDLPVLAAAYKNTGQIEYLNALTTQFIAWLDRCDNQREIYWYNAMEVALRSISWVITVVILGDELSQNGELYGRVVRSLREHMHYIEHNWEWYDGRTSNHYLSNLVGYAYLCWFFGEHKKLDWCRRQLDKEMDWQVFDEGTSYEGSTRYHALVTELFLHGFLATQDIPSSVQTLRQAQGERGGEISLSIRPDSSKSSLINAALSPLSVRPELVEGSRYFKLRRMLLFIERCKINNIPISIGDDDSGIVLHPALVSLPNLAQQLGIACDWSQHELMGVHTYSQFGLSLYRSENWHVSLRHAAYHARQPSGHFHADIGSITLAYNGMPIIIDPGSYLYTASPEWRNFFRSPAQHSTIHATGTTIDQQELFSLALPATRYTPSDSMAANFTAGTATINRELYAINDTVTVIDTVMAGYEQLSWHFIFAPDVQLKQGDSCWLIYLSDGSSITLISDLNFEKYDSWYAPCYGTKVKTVALRARISVNNRGEYRSVFRSYGSTSSPRTI